MSKNCANCKYGENVFDQEPCKECKRNPSKDFLTWDADKKITKDCWREYK